MSCKDYNGYFFMHKIKKGIKKWLKKNEARLNALPRYDFDLIYLIFILHRGHIFMSFLFYLSKLSSGSTPDVIDILTFLW